jgi:hypothetical protein
MADVIAAGMSSENPGELAGLGRSSLAHRNQQNSPEALNFDFKTHDRGMI